MTLRDYKLRPWRNHKVNDNYWQYPKDISDIFNLLTEKDKELSDLHAEYCDEMVEDGYLKDAYQYIDWAIEKDDFDEDDAIAVILDMWNTIG